MKQKNNFIKFLIVLVFCLASSASFVFADETKWISVGMLHDWFSSAGCEVEVGRTHQTADQQDGLQWPAKYKYQDCKAAKALWIGTTDYFDPIKSKTFTYKVIHVGPRVLDEENEFMPIEFKMYGRFNKPIVLVDNDPAGFLDYRDDVDEVDPNLISDRMIYNVVNTALGITEKRKVYAFDQQNHNNYFIYEYVFTNTGIIDLKGTRVEHTLQNVYFHFQLRYSPCKEPCSYGYDWMPQSFTWGHALINDARNESPSNLNPLTWPETAPPRILFSWQGLHSQAKFNTIGAPYDREGGDGRLGAAQYVGVITLHADKSPQEMVDDPFQPTTTHFVQSDEKFLSNNDQFNALQMTDEYALMALGHPALRQADDVGCPTPINCNAYANTYIFVGSRNGNPGGYTHCQGFGPYTLEPGDSVRIIVGEAVNGLCRDSCKTIGAKWLAGNGPFELPDGSTTSDKELFKNSWVYTGQDSIFKTYYRILDRYNEYKETGKFNIPQAPPPPDQFLVTSGGDRIILNWSESAESWPYFAGYRIYRALYEPDTTYDLIYECGAGTKNPQIVHEFQDTSPQRGFDYYYYITTFDDGSQNDIYPGQPLESSMFYTRTNNPANLKRVAGKSLDDIRIVPNPYNIRARDIQFGRSAADRIMFIGIPPVCTIKIYTERGDLIKTIEHTNSTGDEAWNSVTSSRQVVVSGVYIAVFETPDGKKAIRKFVIIR